MSGIQFRPELLPKVLDGRKTVTRRPAGGRSFFPGKTLAVQPGRGQPHVGHIIVEQAHTEHLYQITPEEAQLEGFDDLDAFISYWSSLYGAWDGLTVVWRVCFHVTPFCDDCAPIPVPSGGGGL